MRLFIFILAVIADRMGMGQELLFRFVTTKRLFPPTFTEATVDLLRARKNGAGVVITAQDGTKKIIHTLEASFFKDGVINTMRMIGLAGHVLFWGSLLAIWHVWPGRFRRRSERSNDINDSEGASRPLFVLAGQTEFGMLLYFKPCFRG